MKVKNEMDRLDLWILSVLQLRSADSYMFSMSISEILQEENDTTRISLYKHLKRLVKKNFVSLGPKDNKADSYFITEKGKEELFNIGRQEVDGC